MSSHAETKQPLDLQSPQMEEEASKAVTASYSQWNLIWRRFKKHKAGVVGGYVVILLYLAVFMASFSPRTGSATDTTRSCTARRSGSTSSPMKVST